MKDQMYIINWIFEGQSDKVVDLFLGQNSIVYAFKHRSMLPMDSYAVGYCIANSQCQWVSKLEDEQT